MSNARSRRSSRRARRLAAVCSLLSILAAGIHSARAFHDPMLVASPADVAVTEADAAVSHLLVSEVMAGGASASDEFIEIYNPTSAVLPLEGLEVVYVTASGSTITRKASWAAGSAGLPSGSHLLLANSAGIFASSADLTYSGGLAATGGSIAIRILAAASAIDAVGWGDAASSWLEGTPAAAVAAGHSLERLPGGTAGSGQDTNQNITDFADSPTPDPQTSASTPIPVPTPVPTATASGSPSPAATFSPIPTSTPTSTVTPTISPTPTAPPTPTPTPSPTAPQPISIADARAMADGATVVVQGVALTDSGFSEGGGYVADASGGIAVLVSDGSFARGDLLRVTGAMDDRFSQRTIRADATGIEAIGTGTDPAAPSVATGSVGESNEGQLVEIQGEVASSATILTAAIAFDVDDGSGPIRALVGTATGIDTTAWVRGALVHLRGVVGQRDSSGTGTSGYRVQPRDVGDVLAVEAATPSPSPTPSPSATPSASPTPDPGVMAIAAARALPPNTRLAIRGVVTLPTGLIDSGTAVIQDATGAIMLRLGDEAGSLDLGELVEAAGVRSTKAGMETVRVTVAPRHLGTQPMPDARSRPTGELGETDEAVLVVIQGTVTATPRRTSANNVYFDVDDGSGPIRVYAVPAAEVETEHLLEGTTVELVGVLGQETTGKLPDRGYRLWPRRLADLRIVSQPAGVGGTGGSGGAGTGGGSRDPGSAGGGSGPGAVGAPSSAAPNETGSRARQQNRPRLLAAASLGPIEGRRTSVPQAKNPATDEPPSLPLAAGLLAVGGLLLIGSGIAAGRPELPRELLAWIVARVRGTGDAVDEDPDPRPASALPRLVPLAVVEDGGLAAERAPRAVREERERILPPT